MPEKPKGTTKPPAKPKAVIPPAPWNPLSKLIQAGTKKVKDTGKK